MESVEIRDRLVALEKSHELQWINHEKRSDERWGGVLQQLRKLDDLQCPVHQEKMQSFEKRLDRMWEVFGGTVLATFLIFLATKVISYIN